VSKHSFKEIAHRVRTIITVLVAIGYFASVITHPEDKFMLLFITIVQIFYLACALLAGAFLVIVIRGLMNRYLKGKARYIDFYHEDTKRRSVSR